jgi:hypothetical protein
MELDTADFLEGMQDTYKSFTVIFPALEEGESR